METSNFKNFLRRIQTVITKRLNQFQPKDFKTTLLFVIFVAIFISLSVYLHPEGMRYSFHFYLDTGSITILSTAFLIMAGLLSFASFLSNKLADKRVKIFFLVLTIAFVYLAMDEIFMVHETVGDNIDKTGFLKFIFRNTKIRRWNDLIIILYGLLALPLMIYFFPALMKIPHLLEFFAIAFVFYAIHTTIDSVIEPATTPSYIIEESAKLFSSTFLVLGTNAGFQFSKKS